MRSLAIVLLIGAATAAALPTPSELLADAAGPSGFELSSDEFRDLDYQGLADASPQSVAHLDEDSAEASSLIAGTDVWSLGDEDAVLREIVRWSDADAAGRYVEQLVRFARDEGLAEVDGPFDGARAFSGDDPDAGVWTRFVVWSDGALGASATHFRFGGEPSAEVVDATATSLRTVMAAATIAADPQDPLADGGGGGTSSGGGIPITTVLLWLVIIGGAIWVFVKLRKRLRGASSRRSRGDRSAADDDDPTVSNDEDDDGRSVDDIIERARARRRAEREVEAIPDPNDDWTPPDDY